MSKETSITETPEDTQDLLANTESLEFHINSRKIRIAAICISIIVLFSLVFFSIWISGEIRRGISYQHLISQLRSGTSTSREAALENYFADTALFTLIKRKFNLENEEADNKQETAIKTLFSVVSKIRLTEYVDASTTLKAITRSHLDSILASLPLTTNDRDLLHGILERSDIWHENVKRLAMLESEVPNTISDNLKKMIQQSDLAKDVAINFGQLLSLTPELLNEKGYMEFYSAGILAGMPKLQKLPDNIDDLIDLKNKLDLAGGSVTLRGANVPELFQKRLEQLKNGSLVFEKEINRLSTESDNLAAELKQRRLDAYRQSKQTADDIIELISIIARPNISGLSLKLSSFFKS